MDSNDRGEMIAILTWGVILLLGFVSICIGIRYVYVKTSNAIVSYMEKAPEREEANKKVATEKRKTSAERKIARKEEKEKAKSRKLVKRISKLRKTSSWDDEYGNLMYNADGTLKDPTPNDAYSAGQGYFILIVAVVAVFFVWAGFCTRTPIGMVIASIFILVGSIIILLW